MSLPSEVLIRPMKGRINWERAVGWHIHLYLWKLLSFIHKYVCLWVHHSAHQYSNCLKENLDSPKTSWEKGCCSDLVQTKLAGDLRQLW